MMQYLNFEKTIADLAAKIEELRHLSSNPSMNIGEEIGRLQRKLERLTKSLYSKLSPWEKVQVARHPQRPKFCDYAKVLFNHFTPLAGDRFFGEDRAIVAGPASFNGQSVMVIGQEKGHDTESRVHHNFGMAKPEGYRKAKRLMDMADHFGLPIISFVDTAGAYPGIDAEARGQAEAIARCIETCLNVNVPLITIVIGEGGSGGAIAIAASNHVMMLENSIYSVISPEGCASILWRTATKASEAAQAQRLTAQDLLQFKIIEQIIPEPIGGAHRHAHEVIACVGQSIQKSLDTLCAMDGSMIKQHRVNKFLTIGQV
jgi:acetyl-CoA carboxylase carboxyl transferase subunit alpha